MDNRKIKFTSEKAQALRRSSGQASLEMSVALIVVMILLVAAVKIFAWLNASMVYRQADYEKTHILAGQSNLEVVTDLSGNTWEGMVSDESAYPKLDILK